MRKIRQGVFETNSSSTHSISVHNYGDYDSIAPDEDGIVYVRGEDFGWDQETFTDPESKLSYLMIYVRDWVNDVLLQNMYDQILTDVVCAHTHATGIHMDADSGYIDHQSVENGQLHYLFRDPQLIKDFVFNRASYVETDNDNRY